MPNNINLDIFLKALLLTPFCLAFIYFIIIFASNANVKRVNQWTIKADNLGAKVPQIIEFFYKYAGKLEWFIISVTILLFLLFVDVLSLLILRHGIISDNIVLYSLGGSCIFWFMFCI